MPQHHPPSDFEALTSLPAELFASEVFRRYATRLLEVADARLASELRAKVSPEDVVQSTFKSFFRRLHEFRFDHNSPDMLWGLLVVITIRKCAKWDDVFRAEKRAVSREVRCASGPSTHAGGQALLARDPSPLEAAVFTELVEQLLSSFTARHQQIILLRMEGYELEQIADRIHSSRRTAARVVAQAKDVLTNLLEVADR